MVISSRRFSFLVDLTPKIRSTALDRNLRAGPGRFPLGVGRKIEVRCAHQGEARADLQAFLGERGEATPRVAHCESGPAWRHDAHTKRCRMVHVFLARVLAIDIFQGVFFQGESQGTRAAANNSGRAPLRRCRDTGSRRRTASRSAVRGPSSYGRGCHKQTRIGLAFAPRGSGRRLRAPLLQRLQLSAMVMDYADRCLKPQRNGTPRDRQRVFRMSNPST